MDGETDRSVSGKKITIGGRVMTETNTYMSWSLPSVSDYQTQKNIQVVGDSQSPAHDLISSSACGKTLAASRNAFFARRLRAAIEIDSQNKDLPSYFPGHTLPSPGGLECREVFRGNIVFDQFINLLKFDERTIKRIFADKSQSNEHYTPSYQISAASTQGQQNWPYAAIQKPTLFFLKQIQEQRQTQRQVESIAKAVLALDAKIKKLYKDLDQSVDLDGLAAILSYIKNIWYQSSDRAMVTMYSNQALQAARAQLQQAAVQLNDSNLIYFLFELEAMTSYLTHSGDHQQVIAAGVFAGNYVEVCQTDLTDFGATEFCVRERLFDEIINSAGRGFAPVIINEYGLVADGNHRVTASWLWNVLKFCQDLNWTCDDQDFQDRLELFFDECQKGNSVLLPFSKAVCPVSKHEVLSHLAAYLSTPEYRARLNTYIKPLIAKHDYIVQLPAVLLPEYLCQAVVKSGYDDGSLVQRACPSLYEAMADDDTCVLPPRASYHFTDAALLPWFQVLRSASGSSVRPQQPGALPYIEMRKAKTSMSRNSNRKRNGRNRPKVHEDRLLGADAPISLSLVTKGGQH